MGIEIPHNDQFRSSLQVSHHKRNFSHHKRFDVELLQLTNDDKVKMTNLIYDVIFFKHIYHP